MVMSLWPRFLTDPVYIYRVGQKSKLLILSEYASKTEKIGMWTNKNSYRENEVLSDIFRWNFLLHNCFMIQYFMTECNHEITARQTRTSLRKHDVIKACSIEYLTTQIALVLPTFFRLLDRSQNYRIFNVRATVLPLKYLSQYNSLLFWPTLYVTRRPIRILLSTKEILLRLILLVHRAIFVFKRF